MISESTIRRVRDLAIEDILKPYVNLSKKGATLMGLCPFLSEKTGSFSVSPHKNLYHCFGCNRGGDGINFIMEKENMSFSDAVAFIAKQHNIPIERIDEEQNDEELAESKHKERLLIVYDHVQRFFSDCLRVDMTGECKTAREYAFGRWSEGFFVSLSNILFTCCCVTPILRPNSVLEIKKHSDRPASLTQRSEAGDLFYNIQML